MGAMRAAEEQTHSSQSPRLPSRRSWLWRLVRKSSSEDVLKDPQFVENLEEACVDGTPYAVILLRYVAAWGGEPETILRVAHKPSGIWWDRRLRLRDWLHLEHELAAESEANIRIAAGSKDSRHPARTAADALADAGLLPCLLPPTPMSAAKRPTPDEVVRWRKHHEPAVSKGDLYSILNDEERCRSSALQRFLGVPPPEIPSMVRIVRFGPEDASEAQIIDDDLPVQAILEVRPQDSPEEGLERGIPWSSATHFVTAVSELTPTPDGPDKLVHVFATVVVSEVTTRIACHGLKPAVFYEFEVRAVNAVGISGVVMIRAFAPVVAASELPKVQLEQHAPLVHEEPPRMTTPEDLGACLPSTMSAPLEDVQNTDEERARCDDELQSEAETQPARPSAHEREHCISTGTSADDDYVGSRRVSKTSLDSRASFHSADSETSVLKDPSCSNDVENAARNEIGSSETSGTFDTLPEWSERKEQAVTERHDELLVDSAVLWNSARGDSEEEDAVEDVAAQKPVRVSEEAEGSPDVDHEVNSTSNLHQLVNNRLAMDGDEHFSTAASSTALPQESTNPLGTLNEKAKIHQVRRSEMSDTGDPGVLEACKSFSSSSAIAQANEEDDLSTRATSRERDSTIDVAIENSSSASHSHQNETIDELIDETPPKQEASSTSPPQVVSESRHSGKSRDDAFPPLPLVPPGCHRISGFILRAKQLPPEARSQDIDALVADLQAKASTSTTFSKQQALRMLMGMNMDINMAMQKVHEVVSWRRQHGMEAVRSQLLEQLADTSGAPVVFPHADTTRKLCQVAPCSLTTSEGWPVSVWHVGSASTTDAGKLSNEHLQAWSCAVFEYVDLWIAEQSEQSGHLVGHVQVFNLDGMSFWQATNSTLIAKVKAMLGAGGMYVETISHIYVINSSALFSGIWKIVKGLITPRTASKITVAAGIPPELLAELGPESAQKFKSCLKKGPAIALRPPVLPS